LTKRIADLTIRPSEFARYQPPSTNKGILSHFLILLIFLQPAWGLIGGIGIGVETFARFYA
jgi:hypothetical protein